MEILKKTAYGNCYAFEGVIPFNYPDLSTLEWGDSIRDNKGTGMFMSVNVCSKCNKKYLNSTIILVPNEGSCCVKNTYDKEYYKGRYY